MTDEEAGYTVLVSLYTREEAEVMASALRADGVDAFVENTTHQGMTWLYALALGGYRVFVPWDRVEDSRELIRERLRENLDNEPEARVQRRDRWRVWLLAAMLYGINVYFLILHTKDLAPEDQYDFMEWVSGLTAAPLW